MTTYRTADARNGVRQELGPHGRIEPPHRRHQLEAGGLFQVLQLASPVAIAAGNAPSHRHVERDDISQEVLTPFPGLPLCLREQMRGEQLPPGTRECLRAVAMTITDPSPAD